VRHLRCSQRCCWRFKYSEILYFIDWSVVNQRFVGFLWLHLKVKQSKKNTDLNLNLKTKSLRFFELSVTVRQSTLHNNPEELKTLWWQGRTVVIRLVAVTVSESLQCDRKMTSRRGNYHRDWRIETESYYSQNRSTGGWSSAEFK
jgi:hypothetical protein